MKLTKIQREILESAVASEAKYDLKQPIHVNTLGRPLVNFSKGYSTYCTQMELALQHHRTVLLKRGNIWRMLSKLPY